MGCRALHIFVNMYAPFPTSTKNILLFTTQSQVAQVSVLEAEIKSKENIIQDNDTKIGQLEKV